jgi:hypothetical protein
MQGYWNKPEETRQALRNGWLHSGDIGTMDDEGYVFIVDRVKDMINVSGFKVWPAEVEQFLYKHPAVQEVAVYGKPHPEKGEAVVAAIILKEGATATGEALGASASIGASASTATATGAAHGVTIPSGIANASVNVGATQQDAAVATGAAAAGTGKSAGLIGTAAGTGEAHGAIGRPGTRANAGTAEATATAQGATARVGQSASADAATGRSAAR